MKHSLSALLSALCLTGSLGASTLMLDFGPTAAIDDTGAGNSLTNSPYHTANPSFTDGTWNTVATADVSAGGLVWSDGTTASGIALNIGATTTDSSTTLGLTNTPSGSSALGGFTNTGVYAATSVGTDGIFTSTGSNGRRAVGFQLSGLAAGTYDVYITARNTSASGTQTQNLYLGTSAMTGNFDFAAYDTQSLTYSGVAAATTSWTENANYVHFSVTLTSGDVLNLASYGTTGAEARGFLNSVQIVAVPEPAAVALLAGAGGLLLAATLRRRQSRRTA